MSTRRIRIATCLAAFFALGSGFVSAAGGAGGVFFGLQRPDWNPGFMPALAPAPEIEYFGGYGYGVDDEGVIVGGFGFAMLDTQLTDQDSPASEHIAGGFGGMIAGRRIVGNRNLNIDLCAKLGLGGLAYKHGDWEGYAVAYAEPYLELGLALTPWMRASAAVGYQLVGNIAPGKAFSAYTLRSPTMSFRISWGKF